MMISFILWFLKLPIWLAATLCIGAVALFHIAIEYAGKGIIKIIMLIPEGIKMIFSGLGKLFVSRR